MTEQTTGDERVTVAIIKGTWVGDPADEFARLEQIPPLSDYRVSGQSIWIPGSRRPDLAGIVDITLKPVDPKLLKVERLLKEYWSLRGVEHRRIREAFQQLEDAIELGTTE